MFTSLVLIVLPKNFISTDIYLAVLLVRVMIEFLNVYCLHSVDFPPFCSCLLIFILTYILNIMMLFIIEDFLVIDKYCNLQMSNSSGYHFLFS